MNAEELGALSYRDLQKLAKTFNIKARQPKDALIAAILEAESGSNDNEDIPKKKGNNLNETFDASMASSIFTDDGKSSEAETDEEVTFEVVQKSGGKRKLSVSSKETTRAIRKPKRGRYAEFYVAPRSSSPITSPTTRRSASLVVLSPPTRPLNTTITLESSAEKSRKNSLTENKKSVSVPGEEDEEKEILTKAESAGPMKKESTTAISNVRKSSIGGNRKIQQAAGSRPVVPRKSLLKVPLRKSLVGTPGSVRKARPSMPISTKKMLMAAAQITPSVNSQAEEGSIQKKRSSVEAGVKGIKS